MLSKAQLYTGILPILVILIEFCSAHPHARPHNHHTVDFCSPCRGGSASAHNHSYTRPVIEQQNFDLLKLHLYGKLVDIQRKFNNVKVILRQRVNETANRFNVIVLIQSYQAAANIVSPSLRMYNILKQISHFTRMTLNPFASRQGVCLQNLWQQSDVELAMCYMVQLMASRNIVLPEHVCNERVFAELVTDSEDIRQQMLNDLDRFTNKINQLRRLQIDADMEWCKALEDSDSQES